ncbi:MAG TPA: FAD-binding oxidoreductase [Candidatus Limnocylindria bacterium]|nr:FAD-binding oxidoreductase [Candidatus Limnocylindria bacterium]
MSEDRSPAADVTIVGGGIAGTTAAYALAKRGARVRLIERRSIGAVQSGRNWGFTRRQGCDPLEVGLVQEAWCEWGKLAEEIPDLGLVRRGLIGVADTEARMTQFRSWMKETNAAEIFGTRLVSSEDVRELVPALTGEWLGGMYTPDDGHAQPDKATQAIGTAAARAGATIELGTTVLGITRTGDCVTGVRTDRGDRPTGTVILAAGAWSGRLLRVIGIDLPIRWVRGTAAQTTPAAPITALSVSTPPVGFCQEEDGKIRFGTAAWADHDISLESLRHFRIFLPNYLKNRKMFRMHIDRFFVEDLVRRVPAPRRNPFDWPRVDEPPPSRPKIERAFRDLVRLIPSLQGARIDRMWAGYIDVTPDALPVIGPVKGVEGLLLATGLSSHGFGVGPAVGASVARLALGCAPSVDLAPFAFERFEHARIAPRAHL